MERDNTLTIVLGVGLILAAAIAIYYATRPNPEPKSDLSWGQAVELIATIAAL